MSVQKGYFSLLDTLVLAGKARHDFIGHRVGRAKFRRAWSGQPFKNRLLHNSNCSIHTKFHENIFAYTFSNKWLTETAQKMPEIPL